MAEDDTEKKPWEKHKLWEKPLYPFRVPIGLDDNERRNFKEIYFDVTGSVPSFDTPTSATTLGKVFEEVIKECPKRKKLKVLDFGAGKLRNSIYFLEKGHTVYAVEYECLKDSSAHAKRLSERVDEYSKNFKEYIFPEGFLKSTEEFDLIILINVLTVMPIPAERWLVLLYCHQRLKADGLIFWYSQFGDKDTRSRCTEQNKISDGYYIGKTKKYKTFYREYYDPEIRSMFLSCGFDFHKSIKVPGNQAKMFKKRKNAPLSRVLTAKLIEDAGIIDPTMSEPSENEPKIVIEGVPTDLFHDGQYKECVPNPNSLSFDNLLQECLPKIKPGTKDANDYEAVIAILLSRIFQGELSNLRLQEKIDEGRQRVDFVMTNNDQNGFFWHLAERLTLKCGYILFECKNYTNDIENPEYAQLLQRLGKNTDVGFIICREIKDKTKCLKTQQFTFTSGKLILVLEDEDILSLLNYQCENDRNGLREYLDEKGGCKRFCVNDHRPVE